MKSRAPDSNEETHIATPKKNAKLAEPDMPPLCATTTTAAQRTPTTKHTHSPQQMSAFSFMNIDCSNAVVKGEQLRTIMLTDSGTKDNDRRFRLMFMVKEALSANTSASSLQARPL